MPRPPSPAIAARNEQIYTMWRDGASLVSIAKQVGVTPQRCGQVVASFHPPADDDEDTDRSLFRGYLWRLFDEIRELYDSPGYKMSPNGSVATLPDGELAEDTSVKLQAGELELKILESLRKLDARDRVQAKQVNYTFDVAQQAMMRDIEERRKTIRAEVVRELPPGDA